MCLEAGRPLGGLPQHTAQTHPCPIGNLFKAEPVATRNHQNFWGRPDLYIFTPSEYIELLSLAFPERLPCKTSSHSALAVPPFPPRIELRRASAQWPKSTFFESTGMTWNESLRSFHWKSWIFTWRSAGSDASRQSWQDDWQNLGILNQKFSLRRSKKHFVPLLSSVQEQFGQFRPFSKHSPNTECDSLHTWLWIRRCGSTMTVREIKGRVRGHKKTDQSTIYRRYLTFQQGGKKYST